uniref:CX domain-containing protein n=1 Tax=Rhabditophanes sp. KR3021 TaxID=114890 RepID=A0AC35TZJ0_9BILA
MTVFAIITLLSLAISQVYSIGGLNEMRALTGNRPYMGYGNPNYQERAVSSYYDSNRLGMYNDDGYNNYRGMNRGFQGSNFGPGPVYGYNSNNGGYMNAFSTDVPRYSPMPSQMITYGPPPSYGNNNGYYQGRGNGGF